MLGAVLAIAGKVISIDLLSRCLLECWPPRDGSLRCLEHVLFAAVLTTAGWVIKVSP